MRSCWMYGSTQRFSHVNGSEIWTSWWNWNKWNRKPLIGFTSCLGREAIRMHSHLKLLALHCIRSESWNFGMSCSRRLWRSIIDPLGKRGLLSRSRSSTHTLPDLKSQESLVVTGNVWFSLALRQPDRCFHVTVCGFFFCRIPVSRCCKG